MLGSDATLKDSEKKLELQLQMERLERKLDDVKNIFPALKELAKESKELRDKVVNEITQYALSIRASKLDKDELENFFKYPYIIYEEKRDKENTRHLAIPKFIDVSFGWLEKVTESHNVFLVNPYVDWLGEIPEQLKKELNISDPLQISFDGEYAFGPDTKKIKNEFAHMIIREEKDGRLKIDKARHFEFLAGLIKKGVKPFIRKPVPKSDQINRTCDFELRDYQKNAWDKFLEFSNIGVFFPPSTGKTWYGMYHATHINPPHLIAVPTKILVEQWIERFQQNTDLKVGTWEKKSDIQKDLEVVVLTYQAAINKAHNVNWKSLIIDEVHHLPANEFSKLSTIKRDYTIGLSATPQREDEREEYIFALTGEPVGLSWDSFKKLNIITNPPLHVWIVKTEQERSNRLEFLLQQNIKTIIFCDSIEYGKAIANKYNIPHIHGGTKERLEKIKDSLTSVVSRVGDEGVSLPDIARVIEVNWLHGSRRQELQRFTRLLHGKGTTGEGHIIMTIAEYQKDHKRLFGIMDKGFKIILHREGISDKVFEQKTIIKKIKQTVTQEELKVKEDDYPILKNPRIRKIISLLNKGQRSTLLFFLKKGNLNQSFTVEQLMDEWGMIYKENVFRKLGPLIKKGHIKKQQKKFKQGLTNA